MSWNSWLNCITRRSIVTPSSVLIRLMSMKSGSMSGSTRSTTIAADANDWLPSTVTTVRGYLLTSSNSTGNTSPTPVTRGPTWTTRAGYEAPDSSTTFWAPIHRPLAACMSWKS